MLSDKYKIFCCLLIIMISVIGRAPTRIIFMNALLTVSERVANK
jgi:hypothetical protein